MIQSAERAESRLEAQVADKYRAEGFEVTLNPKQAELPFDLGSYRPDIIAKKLPDKFYVIEVKGANAPIPVERLQSIAEQVAQHPGWRFLLVTGADVEQELNNLLTWDQIVVRRAQAERLLAAGEWEGALLSLWGLLEALIRRHAQSVSIPLERLPTGSLLNYLYSQGELSMEQFDKAKALYEIRNRVAHGYQTPNLETPTHNLELLVSDLIEQWRDLNPTTNPPEVTR